MNTSFEFPKVAQNDPSDVAVAIETAQVLWRRGDLQESLRWVRRAAEAAETQGDDMRALSLARAAADLQDQFRPSRVPPAPASQRASTSAPSAERPVQAVRSAPPPARISTVPSRTSAAPSRPVTELAGAGLDIPNAPLEPWVPPGERSEPAPARTTSQAAPSERHPPPPSAEPERAAAPAQAAPKERVAVPPPGDVRTAVRVSVDASSKDGALLVHILDEGVKAPTGTYEALLVPLAKGIDPRDA